MSMYYSIKSASDLDARNVLVMGAAGDTYRVRPLLDPKGRVTVTLRLAPTRHGASYPVTLTDEPAKVVAALDRMNRVLPRHDEYGNLVDSVRDVRLLVQRA